MLRTVIALSAVLFVVGAWGVIGHSQEPEVINDRIMVHKLDHAQKVLEGVAVKDFKLIEKHAGRLMDLSKMAEWRVLTTPEYGQHSEEFRRHVDGLAKAAKAKNLDAATLSYVQMTISCVNCHTHVREVRIARIDRQ